MTKFHITDGDSIVFTSRSKAAATAALKTIKFTDTARGWHDRPIGECGFYVARRNEYGDLERL